MRIEKASIGQTSIIIDLLKALYLELGEEETSVQFLDNGLIDKMLSSGKTDVWFAFNHNNDVVGICTLTESQALYAGGNYGVIDEMYIVPGYRSKNVGALLVDHVKEIARQKRWKRIDVTAPTEEKWKRTIAFYEKCGFTFTGPKLKLVL